MRELWLQVNSGLASRLRAVIGGIAYCEATGKQLAVDWPFREPSEELKIFEPRMSDLWDHPFAERDSGEIWPTGINGSLESDSSIRYRTCHIEDFLHYFAEPIGRYLGRMTPSSVVQKEIGTVCVPGNSPFVGVNIRYSLKQDNAADPDWFIQRMRQFPANVQFFGSFDSELVFREVESAFPGRIQTTQKTYRYDFMGIVRTCADLYILQKCDWVIGSNHSSYSQMAAFMRGAEYVGPHDKPNGLRGGRYEDMWNPPDESELEKAIAK